MSSQSIPKFKLKFKLDSNFQFVIHSDPKPISNTISTVSSRTQTKAKTQAKAQGYVYVLDAKSITQRNNECKKIIALHGCTEGHLPPSKIEKKTTYFMGKNGPVWILQQNTKNTENNKSIEKKSHQDLLDESIYACFRDLSGALVSHFKTQQLEQINFYFISNVINESTIRASIIGLELAGYNFLNVYNNTDTKKMIINLVIKKKDKSIKLDKKLLEKFQMEAHSIQLARHLVNLPANEINPETVETLIKREFNSAKNIQVIVWDHKKLAAENMNLHLAVGKGSETPPRMIHIKYRPNKIKSAKAQKKPIAFVGKGITFDTGGLDIKPSSGMRLMKKDMGGAAAVIALAYWAAQTNYPRACDFYLALAENSLDAKAMRPGDLYRSRAGFLVEIDNTDAEGRLVLADVLDVAATKTGADEPEVIIDIATLTGAIKVALGTEVSGLFTNSDQLATQLQIAGQVAGEPNWRMPLVQKYFTLLSSHFADFKNSADGFAGAITAALFLEKFCRGKKWVHLDVYCWNDKSAGALTFAGGSGQPVQSMIQWLKSQV